MKSILMAAAFMAIPAASIAQQHPPRPEAIAACKTKSDGDTCQFQGHHGTIVGTCRKAPSSDELVCWHPHHQ